MPSILASQASAAVAAGMNTITTFTSSHRRAMARLRWAVLSDAVVFNGMVFLLLGLQLPEYSGILRWRRRKLTNVETRMLFTDISCWFKQS
ncbi:hypothetical protein KCP69_00785 [Salmonella enterica subsp. enterica]|nr:hypothetical protein KCP69_00785 [Salmonella enterica subsp. enterica]